MEHNRPKIVRSASSMHIPLDTIRLPQSDASALLKERSSLIERNNTLMIDLGREKAEKVDCRRALESQQLQHTLEVNALERHHGEMFRVFYKENARQMNLLADENASALRTLREQEKKNSDDFTERERKLVAENDVLKGESNVLQSELDLVRAERNMLVRTLASQNGTVKGQDQANRWLNQRVYDLEERLLSPPHPEDPIASDDHPNEDERKDTDKKKEKARAGERTNSWHRLNLVKKLRRRSERNDEEGN